ncbi:uncharacterized protein BJX67DRAFT_378880 [Aspergillus lucknowensis]|uniref:Uncharacterized protein n=1 Tax=Aspergillus lucknowensis TaxID=176173 RepID=A0ABR4LZ69_9EURO
MSISANAKSQRWISVRNDQQDSDEDSDGGQLKLHTHHATSGDYWGHVFVLMARSPTSPPLVSPIRPTISELALGIISAKSLVQIAWASVAIRQRKHQPQLVEERPVYVLQPTRDDYFAAAVEDDDDIENTV